MGQDQSIESGGINSPKVSVISRPSVNLGIFRTPRTSENEQQRHLSFDHDDDYGKGHQTGRRKGVVSLDYTFLDLEKFAMAKPKRYSQFSAFIPPELCRLCHMIKDKEGETDLISPCGCSATGLHVHQTCLTSWLHNSGKVRCEACKTVYTNASVKEIRKQLLMQKANLCVIVILMPVGAVLTVTACLLYDAAVKARKHTRLTGEPSDFFGVPTGSFVILCMVFSLVIIASIWASVRMMTRKKTKPGDELKMLTVSKV